MLASMRFSDVLAARREGLDPPRADIEQQARFEAP